MRSGLTLRVRTCRPLASRFLSSPKTLITIKRQSSRFLWSGFEPMDRVVAVMVDKHLGNMVLGSAVLSAMAGMHWANG
jgi:hypothetical protein